MLYTLADLFCRRKFWALGPLKCTNWPLWTPWLPHPLHPTFIHDMTFITTVNVWVKYPIHVLVIFVSFWYLICSKHIVEDLWGEPLLIRRQPDGSMNASCLYVGGKSWTAKGGYLVTLRFSKFLMTLAFSQLCPCSLTTLSEQGSFSVPKISGSMMIW